MTKKLVDVLRRHESIEDLLIGPINVVIERLQRIQDEKRIEGADLIMMYETEYGRWGDDDRQVVNLYDRRLETDEEYSDRLAKEKSRRERELEAKRRQLEMLKKELGES